MGPLEQERRKVHPTGSPADEGFPSASSVPATLHSPPSARPLRGSDLVTDRHSSASACALLQSAQADGGGGQWGGGRQLTAFVSCPPPHDPGHDDGPGGLVLLDGGTLEKWRR